MVGSASAAPIAASASAAARGSARRLVFIDQTHRCPCSADKVEAAWKMMQTFTKQRPTVPVDRLFADADSDRVAALRQEQAYSGLPAIYVLDPNGRVATLLQGDITRADVDRAMQ
jgi:hypothetical protein